MSPELKYEIPEPTLSEIIRLYRDGITLKELETKYNIPYHVLHYRLMIHTRINVTDNISENLGLIQRAEERLIVMARSLKSGDIFELDRYRALLFWTSNADLNNGMVFIPKQLLS